MLYSAAGGAFVSDNTWRRCSACKNPILLNAIYWVCSVSTCNRKRTGLAFCTVSCWEVHLPVANHREAWATESRAPSSGSYVEDTKRETARATRSSVIRRSPSRPTGSLVRQRAGAGENEVLIVVSRMKDYIRMKSGMKASDRAAVPLSEIVRKACDEAIQAAEREGRMTVLDRDVPKPR